MTNIQTQLTAFQQTFAFNGILYTDDMSAYIKANVPGVRDFYVAGTTVDGAPFVGQTSLKAGYFNYQTGVTTNITYLPINE